MIKRTLTISAALLTARVLVVAERRCLKASQTMTLGAKGRANDHEQRRHAAQADRDVRPGRAHADAASLPRLEL